MLSGLSRIFRKPFANVHISRKVPFAHVWQIYACGPRSCKTFHWFLHDVHIWWRRWRWNPWGRDDPLLHLSPTPRYRAVQRALSSSSMVALFSTYQRPAWNDPTLDAYFTHHNVSSIRSFFFCPKNSKLIPWFDIIFSDNTIRNTIFFFLGGAKLPVTTSSSSLFNSPPAPLAWENFEENRWIRQWDSPQFSETPRSLFSALLG